MNTFGIWTSLVEALIAYVLMKRLGADKEGKFQWRMRPFAIFWYAGVVFCAFCNFFTAIYWGERTAEKTRGFFRSLCFLVSEVAFAFLVAQFLMDYGYYSLFRVALLSMKMKANRPQKI
ncbi:unnamed protein product [Notodromas monacha]|uniref:Uncharacterized protein n=1 Tax=Notodromas monacha TaxID=399045 RepID=A0A7R9GAY5_9CRUS|nr:unnamed protein product [Notodromas monacha]CAG0914480.1 unnamed protein product [Notodromas monacha]